MLSSVQDANLPSHGQRRTARGESSSADSNGWSPRRNGGGTTADTRDRPQDMTTANGARNSTSDRCVLEDYTQCSKSHLWRLMMSFYDRKGVESWSQVGRPGRGQLLWLPLYREAGILTSSQQQLCR